MLHHIELYVSDLDASHAFWKPLLDQIGYKETGHWQDGFTPANNIDAYLMMGQMFTSKCRH